MTEKRPGPHGDRSPATSGQGLPCRITLRQGLKNQIKRMAEAVGLQVVSIKRISVGPISVEGITPGQMRELKPLEIEKLHKILK